MDSNSKWQPIASARSSLASTVHVCVAKLPAMRRATKSGRGPNPQLVALRHTCRRRLRAWHEGLVNATVPFHALHYRSPPLTRAASRAHLAAPGGQAELLDLRGAPGAREPLVFVRMEARPVPIPAPGVECQFTSWVKPCAIKVNLWYDSTVPA